MDLDWTPEQDAFRREVGSVFQAYTGSPADTHHNAAVAEMARRGWLTVAFPESAGGAGKPISYMHILADEADYFDITYPRCALHTVAPTLLRIGSAELCGQFLPRIFRGDIDFAFAFTEPDAGSDLGAMTTRAVRDGDDYVVSGQKVYIDYADVAEYLWLAARTDPDSTGLAGISLLIVPADAGGVSIRPMWTMAGDRTNEVFLDEVSVSRSLLVGQEGHAFEQAGVAQGYQLMLSACTGSLLRVYDDLAALIAAGEPDASFRRDPSVAAALAEIETLVRIARLMGRKLVWRVESGLPLPVYYAQFKVWYSEARQAVAQLATEALGAYGQLALGSRLAPLAGRIEQLYRDGARRRITGGPNEVKRDLIARTGLGLPV